MWVPAKEGNWWFGVWPASQQPVMPAGIVEAEQPPEIYEINHTTHTKDGKALPRFLFQISSE